MSLNDAAGLVAYRVALAVLAIHKRLDEPLIETVVTLLTPFAAYLACESLHLSGVLAVVCAGLMVRQKASYLFSAATRLQATAVRDCVVFVLTGLTFIFIGLQMREVVTIIATEEQLVWNSFCALLILVVTIAVRLIWVFPAAWILRLLSAKLRRRDPLPPAGQLLLIGWTGMRGVVSLAAAMALPSDFEPRNLILFVVFVVILGTLVVQGFSLPWLVRKLKLSAIGPSATQQELDARLALLAAANLFLDRRQSQDVPSAEIDYLRSHFRAQADSWLMRLDLDDESILESQSRVCHKTFTGVLTAQRHRLHELVRESIIEESLVQKLEREIDMEESRIKSISNVS